MHYPDVDRLLREERFDELARLSALPQHRRIERRGVWPSVWARVRAALVPARTAAGGQVTIRRARPQDGPAVARLAELDERVPPRGPVLVAEVEDEILAALPLDGSPPVSHPLRPTAGLVDLLELRSRQLERDAA